MELCYRGIRYEHNPIQVKVADKISSHQLQFRGHTYQSSSQIMLNLTSTEDSHLVYRGIAIREGKSNRFLGNYYESKKVNFVPVCNLA
jgi:hypothetical protein